MKTTMMGLLQLVTTSILAICVGCVSIDIQPKDFRIADQVQFQAPAKPFQEISSPSSDRSWKNSKNGNTISYVSECGSISSMNLKSVANSVLSPAQLKIESQKSAQNEGSSSLVTYAYDSSKNIRVKLITERTADCIFNFVYVGSKDSFSENEAAFEEFLKSFKRQ